VLQVWPLVTDSGELRIVVLNKMTTSSCQVTLRLKSVYSDASMQVRRGLQLMAAPEALALPPPPPGTACCPLPAACGLAAACHWEGSMRCRQAPQQMVLHRS
jgi:hypothetical protein